MTMPDIAKEKKEVRTLVNSIKKDKTDHELKVSSDTIMTLIESMTVFHEAHNVFMYNNLSDEVQTIEFINKWKDQKNIYLPVIQGEDIRFRKYTSEVSMITNSYGISEPENDDFEQYDDVDLIIIPGMAFDSNFNRLGRGKGFYDRMLPKLKCPKVGICFDFQFLPQIPTESYDVSMDYIITEKGIKSR